MFGSVESDGVADDGGVVVARVHLQLAPRPVAGAGPGGGAGVVGGPSNPLFLVDAYPGGGDVDGGGVSLASFRRGACWRILETHDHVGILFQHEETRTFLTVDAPPLSRSASAEAGAGAAASSEPDTAAVYLAHAPNELSRWSLVPANLDRTFTLQSAAALVEGGASSTPLYLGTESTAASPVSSVLCGRRSGSAALSFELSRRALAGWLRKRANGARVTRERFFLLLSRRLHYFERPFDPFRVLEVHAAAAAASAAAAAALSSSGSETATPAPSPSRQSPQESPRGRRRSSPPPPPPLPPPSRPPLAPYDPALTTLPLHLAKRVYPLRTLRDVELESRTDRRIGVKLTMRGPATEDIIVHLEAKSKKKRGGARTTHTHDDDGDDDDERAQSRQEDDDDDDDDEEEEHLVTRAEVWLAAFEAEVARQPVLPPEYIGVSPVLSHPGRGGPWRLHCDPRRALFKTPSTSRRPSSAAEAPVLPRPSVTRIATPALGPTPTRNPRGSKKTRTARPRSRLRGGGGDDDADAERESEDAIPNLKGSPKAASQGRARSAATILLESPPMILISSPTHSQSQSGSAGGALQRLQGTMSQLNVSGGPLSPDSSSRPSASDALTSPSASALLRRPSVTRLFKPPLPDGPPPQPPAGPPPASHTLTATSTIRTNVMPTNGDARPVRARDADAPPTVKARANEEEKESPEEVRRPRKVASTSTTSLPSFLRLAPSPVTRIDLPMSTSYVMTTTAVDDDSNTAAAALSPPVTPVRSARPAASPLSPSSPPFALSLPSSPSPPPFLASLSPSHTSALQLIEESFGTAGHAAQLAIKQLQIEYLLQQVQAHERAAAAAALAAAEAERTKK